jgi:hypothetical protein
MLVTLGGTCFAALHAEGAQCIGELRIPCAQPGTERTDVGAVTAGFHAGFVPAHRQALGGAFFAFDDTSEAGIYAVLKVFHVFELKGVKEFSPYKGAGLSGSKCCKKAGNNCIIHT